MLNDGLGAESVFRLDRRMTGVFLGRLRAGRATFAFVSIPIKNALERFQKIYGRGQVPVQGRDPAIAGSRPFNGADASERRPYHED